MGTPQPPIKRFGLTELYIPSPASSALVDLVFVHGLNGEPDRTWTSKTNNCLWPRDLLPSAVEEEKVRILTFGYDADVTQTLGEGVTKDKIHNHAENLVASLVANRSLRHAKERPIIFVAHSLGGLVVKRALIVSSENTGVKTAHLRSVWVSTYGVLFLGTPHKGADISKWGGYLERICRVVVPKQLIDSQPQLLEALKTNSETLINIDRQFANLMGRLHLFYFHEGKPTDMKGTLRWVVEEDSAAPTAADVERAAIQADHSHICKFESESSPGYELVAESIQRYAQEAPESVKLEWLRERETQRIRAGGSLNPPEGSTSTLSSPMATRGNSTADLSSIVNRNPSSPLGSTVLESPPQQPERREPYFIVPPGFRPNTFFIGMEKELKQLDMYLFDNRREFGTAAVLLHGAAGGGKTHLARQYVHTKRDKFPGGIFWINSHTPSEMYKDFFAIFQKVVTVDAPEMVLNKVPYDQYDSNSYVQVVKSWFESRHDWLIIMDGLRIMNIKDVDPIGPFIPDSKDSSLLFVSRSFQGTTVQRMLRPKPVKVPPLKLDDARKLLFKMIPISKPKQKQIKSANDLLEKVGGLPLAIDAIARRLADTHEPIEKYNMRSYPDDPRLKNIFQHILDDLKKRGYDGPYQLIKMLSFFGPNIPVEMVNLGLKSLKAEQIDVRSREEGDDAPDINTTYSILMRYALLERNDPDDANSISSSKDSLIAPEPIDMLKMHMMIQSYCREESQHTHEIPRWLRLAIRLFAHSFREADRRIKARTKPARVTDYREYDAHGHVLREHIRHYSKSYDLSALKGEFEPVMIDISLEIRDHEPGSSQESVERIIEVQDSIFDRTGSSSSSGQSIGSIKTPGHRPTPLNLDSENEFGFPLTRPTTDSPSSLGEPSPRYLPRIVNHSPGNQLPLSYDGGGEDMERELSGSTARPGTSSTMNQEFGLPPKKPRQPSAGLSNITKPSPLTQMAIEHALGSIGRSTPQGQDQLSGSSDAVTALTKVTHRSPPPTRESGSIWSRSSSNSRNVQTPKQTYASVIQGQPPTSTLNSSQVPPRISSAPQADCPFLPPGEERGRGRDPGIVPAGTTYQSPFAPIRSVMQSGGQGYDRYDAPYSQGYAPSQPDPRSFRSDYQQPNVRGPNPSPLPYDVNVTVTRGQHSTYNSRPGSQSPESQHYTTPPLAYPVRDDPPNFADIAANRMSRDGSNQTRASITHSEPPPHRMYSPPMQSSPFAQNIPTSHSSPRMRLADGSPAQKSPKLAHSNPPIPMPRYPSAGMTSSEAYPMNVYGTSAPITPLNPTAASLLYGTGGWASNTPSNHPSPHTVPPITTSTPNPAQNQNMPPYHFSPGNFANEFSPTVPSAANMSRNSSGPGLKIHGLGIAEFGDHVTFGQLPPTSVTDARRRARDWEVRIQAGDPHRTFRRLPSHEEKIARARAIAAGFGRAQGAFTNHGTVQMPQMPPMHDEPMIASWQGGYGGYGGIGTPPGMEERGAPGRSSAPQPPYPGGHGDYYQLRNRETKFVESQKEIEEQMRKRGYSAPEREGWPQ